MVVLLENVLKLLEIVILLNTIFAFITVFKEKRSTSAILAWLLVLVLLPIVGFIIYFFLGRKVSKKKIYTIHSQLEQGTSNIAKIQLELLDKEELFTDSRYSIKSKSLATMFLHSDDCIVTENNDVKLFIDGHDKFDSLFNDLKQAKEHIHLLYYTIKNDKLGRKLIHLLEEKAAEGVEVLLVYDAMGSRGIKKKDFAKLEQLGGVTASFFSSPFGLLNFRINFRNHRKIAVIDGSIGYIGGFNIGDEYLGLDPKFGYWRDTHLKVQGNAVLALQNRFLMDWNVASPKSQKSFSEKYFPIQTSCGNTSMQIVSSGPDSDNQYIKKGYLKMIQEATKSIHIQTPYFIPDDGILEALTMAAMSGVEVNIMIPNKPDHPFVYRATMYYAKEMVEAGVNVYIYDNGFLHAKTITIDGEISSIGTANFDVRSFKLNFEVNSFIYSREIAQKLEDIYKADCEKSYLLTPAILDQQSWWLRFKQVFSRLLAPLL